MAIIIKLIGWAFLILLTSVLLALLDFELGIEVKGTQKARCIHSIIAGFLETIIIFYLFLSGLLQWAVSFWQS